MEAIADLIFDLRDLPVQVGASKDFDITFTPAEPIGLPVLAVREQLQVRGQILAVSDGVLVSGDIRGRAEGECVRCLDAVDQDVDEHFDQLFVEPQLREKLIAAGDSEAEDWLTIGKDRIDLTSTVIDTVVPSLDPRPLCEDNCPGLCAQCGFALREDPDHSHEVIDDRWAALAKLKDEL